MFTYLANYGIGCLRGDFMPRTARVRSKSGIYHIIMRGINRQVIFREREDSMRFIHTLLKYKETCGYEIYAYCLMRNHLHLLLKEGKEPLGTVMRRICSSYVLLYNKKYNRVGYLFQDRFRSEPVEDKAYFLTALRYIFQNPVKAGIVARVQDYAWTNYKDYIKGSNKTDIDTALGIFHQDREKAIRNFIGFVNMENDDQCLDIEEGKRVTDDEAGKIIRKHCGLGNAADLQKIDKVKRDSFLKELKDEYGLSIRQIERLTGINRGVIQRV